MLGSDTRSQLLSESHFPVPDLSLAIILSLAFFFDARQNEHSFMKGKVSQAVSISQ